MHRGPSSIKVWKLYIPEGKHCVLLSSWPFHTYYNGGHRLSDFPVHGE